MDLFKSLGKAMSFAGDDADGDGAAAGNSNPLRGSSSPSKSKRKASPESPAGDGTSATKKKKKSLADKIMSANPFSMLNPFDTAEADVKAAIAAKESALGAAAGGGGGKKATAAATRKGSTSRSPDAAVAGGGSPTPRTGSRSRSESMSSRAAKSAAGSVLVSGAPHVVHTAAASLTTASVSRGTGRPATESGGRRGADDNDALLAPARSGVYDEGFVRGSAGAGPLAKRSGVFGTPGGGALGTAAVLRQPPGLSPSSIIPSDHPWNEKSTLNASLGSTGGVAGVAGTPYQGLTSLQGTSRVRYQCSTLVQGNVVHFIIVVVDDVGSAQAMSGVPNRDGAEQSSGSSSGSKCLALVGLLEPLGAVRSSCKAILQRCAAIRKLERVRISPREREMSLALLFDKSDPLLVDPEQAPVMGLILPFLRPLQGVSTVDGYRAEFWVACDASGLHKAPLFDVEGPIDELNQAAVLRLRCHDMRREDIRPQGALPASDVATQTVVHEARSLLQRDFDAELEQLKSDQKKEVDGLKVEVRALRIELENCRHDAAASAKSAQATEAALVAEIEALKKQLAARVSATQTYDQAVAVSTQVSIAPSDTDASSHSDDHDEENDVRAFSQQKAEQSTPRRLPMSSEASRIPDAVSLQAHRQTVEVEFSRPTFSPDTSRYRGNADPHRRTQVQAATPPMLEPPVESSLTGSKSNIFFSMDPTLMTPLQYSQVSRARETEDVLAKVRDRIAKSEAYLKKSSPSSGVTALRSVR